MTQPVTERPEGAPAGYTLRFPDSWWQLDLDPSTRDASIRRRIEDQVKQAPQLSREQVDALIRTTRRTAREAHAQGALRASGNGAGPGETEGEVPVRAGVLEEERAVRVAVLGQGGDVSLVVTRPIRNRFTMHAKRGRP
ncbi:hypothetical protein ACF05W_33030 [Streptomyces lydicus]|uniref:hypothetical protein n=1 Tax=Streptomyces lydicus TaxID=47763 RepID=UPI0037030E3F